MLSVMLICFYLFYVKQYTTGIDASFIVSSIAVVTWLNEAQCSLNECRRTCIGNSLGRFYSLNPAVLDLLSWISLTT